MPGLPHETLVSLFRDFPHLAPDLLKKLSVPLPEYDEVRIESSDFSQLIPMQFLADLLVLLVRGQPVLAIVLEAQMQPDNDKRVSWPLYVTAARANFKCPACLVVVTVNPEVVAWARKVIDLGPGGSLQPIVIGPADIPAIQDQAVADQDPELALLSAVAHATDEDAETAAHVAFTALVASLQLDSAASTGYADVVQALLSAAARTILEAIMQSPQHHQFHSEFARKYAAQGKAEGKTEGKAEAILLVLQQRGFAVTDAQRTLLVGMADVATLDRWLTRAVVAATADEVFS